MATEIKLRRGTTAQHASFNGAEGEVTYDTDKHTLIVHNNEGNGTGRQVALLSDVQAEDTLAEMNDVNLTSPSGGSFLQYDNASSKWIDTQTIVQHTDGIKIEGTSEGSSLFGSSDFGLAVDNNSGVGAIQVSGSTLAYIDLQTPEGDTSDVFDVRLISGNASNGTYPNAQLIAKGQNLDIKTTTSGDVTLQRQGSVKLSTSANGIDVTGEVKGDSLDIDGNADISGNLVLGGDLNVTGTTTTVNQTNLDVSDNIIGLNRGASTNANDSGFIIERGSTGDNAIFAWDESADKFTLGTTTATPSSTGNLSITTGTLVANVEGNLTGDVTGNVSGTAATVTQAAQTAITSVGDLTALNVNGTVTADGIQLDGDMETNGDITIQRGHKVTFDDTSGNEAFNIQVSVNDKTILTESGSGNFEIRADRNQLLNADASSEYFRGGDNNGVKIFGENKLRIATGNGTLNGATLANNIHFYTGDGDAADHRTMLISPTGLDVNGKVTADSATFSSTAGVGDNNENLIVESTNSTTTNAPDIVFRKTPSDNSGVSNDESIGQLAFQASNTANETETFARITGVAKVATDGAEEGQLEISIPKVSAPSAIQIVVEPDLIKLRKQVDVTGKITATSSGIADNDVAVFGSGVADDDFLRINGTEVEGRSASEVLSDIGALSSSGNAASATIAKGAAVIHNQTTDGATIGHADVAGYVGKTVVYTNTGDSNSLTLGIPQCTEDVAVGEQIHLVNASTGSGASAKIILDLNESGDAQNINICTGATVADVGTTDPHIIAGGVATLVAVAANEWILFGSGVVDNS